MSNPFQHDRSAGLETAIGDALRQAESAVVVDRADLDRRREALLGWMSDHMDTDPVSPADQALAERGADQELDAEPPVPEPVRTGSHSAPRVPRVPRVLVVDDNQVIRQLIRVNLELEGFEVVTAADGLECLHRVHEARPDLVLLDAVMPRLDGLRTAARLRADPQTRTLPLVIVSACTQYEIDAGLDIGIDAYLAKPFEPAELIRLVRQLIDRKRSEADYQQHPAETEPVLRALRSAVGEAERAGCTGGC